MATGREIVALLGLVLLVTAAGSLAAYAEVRVPLAVREWRPSEPTTMLIAGSALVALGGMLRRIA